MQPYVVPIPAKCCSARVLAQKPARTDYTEQRTCEVENQPNRLNCRSSYEQNTESQTQIARLQGAVFFDPRPRNVEFVRNLLGEGAHAKNLRGVMAANVGI